MSAVLRLSAFRRLLAAYVLNELAWSVGTLALSLLVYRRTGSAIGSTGFFLCSQVAPAVVSPPLVARLDPLAPNRLLPTLYLLEAVLFGILAWMTSRFALAPVLALALLDGVVAIVARAMAAAVRAQVLKPLDLVPEGNAVSNAAFAICFMAGPLLGGAVVVAGGTVAALLANCGLFAVMSLVLAGAGLPGSAAIAGERSNRLRGAIGYARGDPALRALLILQGFGLACFTISVPVEVVYARHALHAGAGGYGGLLSAWGGGAIVGSIVVGRWRRGAPAALIGGSGLALALGFGVMAAAPSLTVGLLGAAVAGIGNGIGSTAVQTAVQERAPAEWMALIMSLNQSISQLAPGVGILAGGVLAALTSSRVALAVAGAGSFAFAVAVAIALRPAVMRRARPVIVEGAGRRRTGESSAA
ncbi:MAG: MFS transporter [Solirubrobacterales bacterium]|nr:MFS transporter [Solirubrobacterales bacterium]